MARSVNAGVFSVSSVGGLPEHCRYFFDGSVLRFRDFEPDERREYGLEESEHQEYIIAQYILEK